MKKLRFTQGEWKIDSRYADDPKIYWHDIKVNGITIAEVKGKHYRVPNKNCDFNAKLIAAAPHLLEALMNIENDNGSIPASIWEMRNKAIKKAIG